MLAFQTEFRSCHHFPQRRIKFFLNVCQVCRDLTCKITWTRALGGSNYWQITMFKCSVPIESTSELKLYTHQRTETQAMQKGMPEGHFPYRHALGKNSPLGIYEVCKQASGMCLLISVSSPQVKIQNTSNVNVLVPSQLLCPLCVLSASLSKYIIKICLVNQTHTLCLLRLKVASNL